MQVTINRILRFSNHIGLVYKPEATDLAIAPNLQHRSHQSCQRLELHAVARKTLQLNHLQHVLEWHHHLDVPPHMT